MTSVGEVAKQVQPSVGVRKTFGIFSLSEFVRIQVRQNSAGGNRSIPQGKIYLGFAGGIFAVSSEEPWKKCRRDIVECVNDFETGGNTLTLQSILCERPKHRA